MLIKYNSLRRSFFIVGSITHNLFLVVTATSLTKLNRKSTVRRFDKRVTRYAVSVHIKAVSRVTCIPSN